MTYPSITCRHKHILFVQYNLSIFFLVGLNSLARVFLQLCSQIMCIVAVYNKKTFVFCCSKISAKTLAQSIVAWSLLVIWGESYCFLSAFCSTWQWWGFVDSSYSHLHTPSFPGSLEAAHLQLWLLFFASLGASTDCFGVPPFAQIGSNYGLKEV